MRGIVCLAGLACGSGLLGAGVPDQGSVSKFMARMPLSFERNAGQVADRSASWVGHANGYSVALGATGATIIPTAPGRSDAVRMQFVDARPGPAAGPLEPLPGKTNYLVGRDPKSWLQGLETYGRIAYRGVYDGIDVAWYGNQGQLEYDFRVQPGADPSRIRVRFEGARMLALESTGDVRIETAAGSMKLRLPEIYQETAGGRARVRGRYVLRAANEIGFELASYDRLKPLVIDPTLVYGAYFGSAPVTAITTDTAGNVYLGGNVGGPHGGVDVWLTKLDPTGTTVLYSTYVGGSAQDSLVTQSSLAVTASGELIATGQAFSTDFPLVNAIQSQGPLPQTCIPFAFKLDATGSTFVYSTYVGGRPPEGATPWAVATDAAGSAYIAGEADGSFATTPGAYQSVYGGGWSDAFVAKVGPSGAMVYATMLGGTGLDYAVAVATDTSGSAYIAGLTGSTTGAFGANAGGIDTFVAKVSPDGSGVSWLTMVGGKGDDLPTSMARDSATGKLYVAGYTNSADLPTTAGVFQPVSNGPRQGFVTAVNPDGSAGFLSYLGGGREDGIQGIAVTPTGVVVAGSTTSTGFPVVNALQPAFSGGGATFYASADSGATWTPADTGLPASVIGISPDPSSPGTMLAASGDSYSWFRTTSGGAPWTSSGDFPLSFWYHAVGAQFVRSVSHPAAVYVCYPSSSGQTTSLLHYSAFNAFGSSDGGATWRLLAYPPSAPGDWLMGLAVSPADGNTILEVTFTGAVFRSTDGGASFTQASSLPSGMTWIYPQSVAVSSDGSVYVAAGQNVYKSTDFGTTWTPANGIPDWQGMGPIAVSPSNPSVVYAGSVWASPNGLYRTTDAGATWHQVTTPWGWFPTGASMVVAPTNPQVVYVASGNQAQVSKNGGATWSSPATLPGKVWALAVSPSNPTAVYAAAGSVTSNGFAAKIGSDGKALLWSTFYSGSAGSSTTGVAAAPSGDVWIAGNTESADLPVTTDVTSSSPSGGAAFLARISDTTAACSYSLHPPSLISYGGGSGGFGVTAPSGCAWTATTSDSWITLTPPGSGVGSGIVYGTIPDNNTGATRTGTVGVNGQTFTLIEADSSCTYSVSTPASLSASGGTVQLTVTAPAGCPWGVTPFSPVVAVVSGSTGTGNGTVTLSVAANSGVQWLSPLVAVGPQPVTLSEADACTYVLAPLTLASAAASGSISVTANLGGCSWSATSDAPWLTISSTSTVTGSGSFPYSAQENDAGAARTAHVTLDHQQFTITQSPPPGLYFVPVTPCRVADTRGPAGPFGSPSLVADSSRSFAIPQSGCGIPATAQAYSLNVTVVPQGPLYYLTLWPDGQTQPVVSTLNSWDGSVVANAAIVPAGTGGGVSVYVPNATDLILDVNGYFDSAAGAGAYSFYPSTPCRVADTRVGSGALGGPSMSADETRDFPVPSSACGLPSTASAYSMNVTVVPAGYLGYLTTWATGQPQPVASTLNSWTGKVVANAALVPAGTGGSVSVLASNPTDVILDTNGYFGAPGGAGALNFHPVTPCRVVDTRGLSGPFGGPEMGAGETRSLPIPTSPCGIPAAAAAYSLNVTVVPDGYLAYLTVWPAGAAPPVASTLNSWDGSVVANAAIVPAGTGGAVSVYVPNPTQVIIDIDGYFAP